MDSSSRLISTFSSDRDEARTLRFPNRLHSVLRRLDAQEVSYVRILVNKSRKHPRLGALNGFINSMGNGWLYLPLAIMLFLLKGWGAWRFMVAASLSVTIAHLLYPWVKSFLARQRPHDFDPDLRSTVKALDLYSCPSGHCMTATAVGIPLVLTLPSALIPMLAVWLIIAWSRLSLAHHYPTDLLLGGLMGSVIAVPVARFFL
jgi:undecaprenyl-diphosphatase